MTPDRVALRDEMEHRAAEYLEKHGHGSFKGQHRRRTKNAANVQLYDLRRQNSSLLGMGFPARAHAFGSSYYTPNIKNKFDDTFSSFKLMFFGCFVNEQLYVGSDKALSRWSMLDDPCMT